MHNKHLILAVLVTAVWGLNSVNKPGLAAIDPLLLTVCSQPGRTAPESRCRSVICLGWLAAYGPIFGGDVGVGSTRGIELCVASGTAALLVQFSAFFTLGWGVLLPRALALG